jgi:16S rRNA processing protein RimM
MKVSVAYIKGPRGFKGELAAILYRPSSQSLKPGLKVTIQKEDRSRECTIEYIKPLRNRIGLKLSGIENEETASNWRHGEILVEKKDLEPLDENQYYHFEIEGARVYEEGGDLIGTVTYLGGAAGNDLLYVKTDESEIMIPFVKAIVKSVDVENRRIVIKKIEGLY